MLYPKTEWIVANIATIGFYHIMWFSENKNNRKKLSNIFTLWGSLGMTVFSVFYLITKNEYYSMIGHATFYNSMIIELIYGSIYFPKYMYLLTTYIHHFIYIGIEYYLLFHSTDVNNLLYYFPQEFPTFLLACKRYFDIHSKTYDLAVCYAFILLRFFYFFYVSFGFFDTIKKNTIYITMLVGIGILQSKWCYDLLIKNMGNFKSIYENNRKPLKEINMTEKEIKPDFPFQELSFHSSAWMKIFQFGSSMYIQNNYNIDNCKFVGSSAGALIACTLSCNVKIQNVYNEIIRIREIYKNNIFMMCNYAKNAISKFMPEDCIDIIKNRLTIVCSKVDRRNLTSSCYNNFKTRIELIEYLNSSLHIPLLDGIMPVDVNGELLYDGMLTDTHPSIQDNSLKITWDNSCYCGCTKTASSIFPKYKIPVYWLVFPPSAYVLSLLYYDGYYTTKQFFVENKYDEMTEEESEEHLKIVSELKEMIESENKTIQKYMYLVKGISIAVLCTSLSNFLVFMLNNQF